MVGKALVQVRVRASLFGLSDSGSRSRCRPASAQIGEFSFIVGHRRAARSGLLPDEGFQLIVAGALLSIALNPLLFRAVDPLERAAARRPRWLAASSGRGPATLATRPAARRRRTRLRLHAILCGYGRVGRMIGPALERRGFRYVVDHPAARRGGRGSGRAGSRRIYGDAANPEVLREAQVEHARLVIVAGDRPERDPAHRRAGAGAAARRSTSWCGRTATRRRPSCAALSRKVQAVHGERELAVQMARYALRRFGVSATEAEAIAQGLRGRPAPAVEPVRAPSRWRDLISRARSRGDRSSGSGSEGSGTGTG